MDHPLGMKPGEMQGRGEQVAPAQAPEHRAFDAREIVIEHNLDVISQADWVIDMGPGAGRDGGTMQFEGVPGDLAKAAGSLTGSHLAGRVLDHLTA